MTGTPWPPPPLPQRIKPSVVWYWIAGLILVVGVSVAIGVAVTSVTGVLDRIGGLQHISVPGQEAIHISQPEGKVVYFEGRGRPSPENLGLSVTDPDGRDVNLSPYLGDVHYEISGRRGVAIATFDATKPGDYMVDARRSGIFAGSIAVGDSVFGGLLGHVGIAAVVGGVCFLVALMIVIVVAVRRGNAKRSLQGGYQWQQ